MSQNLIEVRGRFGPARVRAGWDAPLGELFCSVEDLSESAANELPDCYSNTSYAAVDDIVSALAEAGIEVPAPFLAAVRKDASERAGSVLRTFSSTGALLEERNV